MNWTNQAAAASITRSQGLTVNWTGGAPGTVVLVKGGWSAGNLNGLYTCAAPAEAGTFTVPPYVLANFPAGPGGTTVANQGQYTPFSATGLDFGLAFGEVSISANSTYK